MKPETEQILTDILDQRDKQAQAAHERSTTEADRQAKNLSDFKGVEASVIRPAFHEIVALYAAKKYPCRIEEREEETGPKGQLLQPLIRLNFELGGSYSDATLRQAFTLYFDKSARTCWIYASTLHSSGPAGKVPLDGVTADWLHAEFLKYASKKY